MALTHAEMNVVITEELAALAAKSELAYFREDIKVALSQIQSHRVARNDPRVADMLESVKKKYL